MTKKMFDGNGAAAEAIRLARPKVLAVYPITPQSTISERLAEMVDFGELDAKYIRVESEHSAMSAVTAASLTGVRATTATASQGLALMTEVLPFCLDGVERRGRDFMDYADTAARQAYYTKPGTPERMLGMDFLWFLWAGRNSPIFGRDRMTTFERRLIADEDSWTEAKNAYYTLYENPEICDKILREFGLEGPHCHIINGHVPVKARKGESPIKGGGKLIVIDGGFCKAYQPTSGIAGYTLVYNPQALLIVAHQPFIGRERAIRENYDATSSRNLFERMEVRQKISQTDIGRDIQNRIDDLQFLLGAYRDGTVVEAHR